MTTSFSPSSGSRSARTWLSPPAFLCRFSRVSNTSTPAATARSGVASVQLSATTMMRSGAASCACNASMVAEIRSASLCAGTRTVIVTGPWNTPRVAAMTTFGASGMSSASEDLR